MRKTITTRKYTTTTYTRTAKHTTPTTNVYSVTNPKFNPIKTEVVWRVGSYRNIYTQFATGNKTVFSPTVANKWIRYINNGVQVYQFTNQQFTKYFGNRWTTNTPTAARKYLTTRYGKTIKDVIRGNNNTWLVATTKTPTARPFTQYNWTNWK
jgi:hypothetical protein